LEQVELSAREGPLDVARRSVDLVAPPGQRAELRELVIIERDATYDGIVSRYRGLIEDTASGEAAVV